MSRLFVMHVNLLKVINFVIVIIFESRYLQLSLSTWMFGDRIKCQVEVFKYHVSFLVDSNHCTWIYLINNNLDAEQIFYNFQKHVEHLFNAKILRVQSDYGGEYRRLHKYFQDIRIIHRVHVLKRHNKVVWMNDNTFILLKQV